ncbi:MAG: NADH:ubiquinone reductase (Na(+)-transporting) subunit C [Muribaculaceae bacterium]|nr:NADH:ubiquinone reductase (Na(+)-transporting) subunit C [Muribaculaceae bacterium]
MNKNSNTYQIIYSAIMVVLVGAVLALIYMSLKPLQDENIANDKRKQILTALHVATASDAEVKAAYEKYIVQDMLVSGTGEVVDTTAGCAFDVNMASNVKLAAADRKLPVLKCKTDDGSTKYVIPVYGAGLWGPIWGYIAIADDGSTVYGANFSHKGETPGLGARITEEFFLDAFKDKQLFKDSKFTNVEVVKKGQKPSNAGDYVDAITGATITSRGVSDMLKSGLAPYEAFLKTLQGAQAE